MVVKCGVAGIIRVDDPVSTDRRGEKRKLNKSEVILEQMETSTHSNLQFGPGLPNQTNNPLEIKTKFISAKPNKYSECKTYLGSPQKRMKLDFGNWVKQKQEWYHCMVEIDLEKIEKDKNVRHRNNTSLNDDLNLGGAKQSV